MNDHPNKDIREAVDYALSKGWRLRKSGGSAHAWGRIYCPAEVHGACIYSIFSTPKNPVGHARWIRRVVDHCTHED